MRPILRSSLGPLTGRPTCGAGELFSRWRLKSADSWMASPRAPLPLPLLILLAGLELADREPSGPSSCLACLSAAFCAIMSLKLLPPRGPTGASAGAGVLEGAA